MVNMVVKEDELMVTAIKMAEKIAFFPASSIAATKIALNKGMDIDLNSQIGLEVHLQSAAFRTPEHKEGIKALKEKRLPKFS